MGDAQRGEVPPGIFPLLPNHLLYPAAPKAFALAIRIWQNTFLPVRGHRSLSSP